MLMLRNTIAKQRNADAYLVEWMKKGKGKWGKQSKKSLQQVVNKYF